jgi:hypothetical protein
MHRALEDPVILYYVLGQVPAADLSPIISVNRRWASIAFVLVWKEVQDVKRLLSLLYIAVPRSEVQRVSRNLPATLFPVELTTQAVPSHRFLSICELGEAPYGPSQLDLFTTHV